MERKKTIALVAHDNMKPELIDWVDRNRETLLCHKLICTGTTGRLLEEEITKNEQRNKCRLDMQLLKSGPLGGDQQLGARIAEREIDALIFFWDPMEAQPHDVDVKALLRLATLYNVPTAVNRSTADFIIDSPLFDGDYEPTVGDFQNYTNRPLCKR